MWHGLSDPYRVLHKVAVVYERIYVNEVKKIRNRQIACSLLSKLFDNTHAAISIYYVLRDTQLLIEYFVCVLAKLLRKNVACVDVNRKLLAEPWYRQSHRQGAHGDEHSPIFAVEAAAICLLKIPDRRAWKPGITAFSNAVGNALICSPL